MLFLVQTKPEKMCLETGLIDYVLSKDTFVEKLMNSLAKTAEYKKHFFCLFVLLILWQEDI